MPPVVVIIGGGLAGLSTAYHLEKGGHSRYTVLEAEERPGGLVRSEKERGFTFDYTGHLLHIKSAEMKGLMKTLWGEGMFLQDRESKIILKGCVTDYPFQVNTYGLPADIIKECILGLIKAKYESNIEEVVTFEDWILKSCGAGVAKWFMYPYNLKMWTVHPREMTCDWLSDFVPEPSVEQALEGALKPSTARIGYNAEFWYPKSGGIEYLVKGFLPHISPVETSRRVERVDLKAGRVFAGGEWVEYERLVSTMPIKELVRAMGDDVPADVRDAAEELKIAGIFSINYGVRGERSGLRARTHWYYFPEPELIFHRVGLPSNLTPSMVPDAGCFSLCAEISYSEFKPIPGEGVAERCRDDLLKVGLLRDEDEILVEKVLDLPYAYVIFDDARARALSRIEAFLKEWGIMSIGRYGKWAYSTMERAVLDGLSAAESILGEKGS